MSSATDCIRPGTSARDELPPTSSAAMPTTVIAMNSAELVIAISCPPMWPMRGELGDLELMNWIGHRRSFPSSYRPEPRSVSETPAARITLNTPAAKPSRRNTIIPHGEIPSHLSSAQPMNAPTRTPATSSVESRKPRASAEAF